jgi:hypothetical protein
MDASASQSGAVPIPGAHKLRDRLARSEAGQGAKTQGRAPARHWLCGMYLLYIAA